MSTGFPAPAFKVEETTLPGTAARPGAVVGRGGREDVVIERPLEVAGAPDAAWGAVGLLAAIFALGATVDVAGRRTAVDVLREEEGTVLA